MNQIDLLYQRAIHLQPLTIEEAVLLYETAPLDELCMLADELRYQHVPGRYVTWQIDRNVNITNVCISGCKFCNFHCKPSQQDKAFVTTIDQYLQKIEETLRLGGDQLLLQGGLHPKLKLNDYETLFKELKRHYPQIKLHALGPPEIVHISRISGTDYRTTLTRLMKAGLDSLPGAGAEILDSDIRKRLSPGKCSAEAWIEVMRQAHQLGLATSATMMYGHIETPRQRIEHLVKLRDLQAEKPEESYGFIAFIPWIFCSRGTVLEQEGVKNRYSALEYIRLIAISRIILNNIHNIQASWLTVGTQLAQVCLHAGANDLGSIMIEENVVSSAGASYKMDAEEMCQTIRDAGFIPLLRDQKYNPREWPFPKN